MEESDYFCNSWECPHRKNGIHKNEMLCDLVWCGCPDDDETLKQIENSKED